MDEHQAGEIVTTLLAWIEVAALSLELLAVGIIIVVALASTGLFARNLLADRRLPAAYERYKVQLGRGLLLGLEMLVAADVVRTVALELVAQLAPDLVIMDVMMPEMDGITATRELRQRFPQVRVLALTSFGEGALVQRALQAGAIGYLLKDTQGSELVGAVRTAFAGAPVLSPDVTRALVSALNTPPAPGGDLSERELAVLRLMVMGLSNEQIAEQLYISRNTVRHHVHNILGKLGAANRTEAVALAMQHNLVP